VSYYVVSVERTGLRYYYVKAKSQKQAFAAYEAGKTLDNQDGSDLDEKAFDAVPLKRRAIIEYLDHLARDYQKQVDLEKDK
jgi:hypothetical protein